MKKIICLLLCVGLFLCITACQKKGEAPGETESSTVAEDQVPTEDPENKQDGDAAEIKLLTLEKALYANFEWVDDYNGTLVRSEYSCVTLGQEDADAYPEMAQVLRQIAAAQENAMLDEFSILATTAREEFAANRDGFETYTSLLNVQVRRADSVVVSLLSDSYLYCGGVGNYRALHGSNYDPESGKMLELKDVVKEINGDLALAVQEELTGHMWTGDFYSESAVEDYFTSMPDDGISWTVDYIGVTFYFAPGDLCDEGSMTATVSFAEHPELFNEKYMTAPTAYTVELPQDISFFTQLDGDSALEEIAVSGLYDAQWNNYTSYGIYTDTDGQYYEEECYTHALHPYYVKAAEGNYLYLFCEDLEEEWRQMRLMVFSLNEDGSVTKSGEMNLSPSWRTYNQFVVPTDPGNLILDDADNDIQNASFVVGSDGLPEK